MRVARNIVFKIALFVLSGALAFIGILAWAYAARFFDALAGNGVTLGNGAGNAIGNGGAPDWALLDPLWPLYGIAAIACVAAQFVAACAVINFDRLAERGWRIVALCFYGVAVIFAAYSADKGAQVILGSAHRAQYEAREAERSALVVEIAALQGVIREERRQMSAPGAVGPVTRAAETEAYLAATAVERARLPEAQRALDERPSLPREVEADPAMAIGVFLIFLAWAILEPWGYALAERGRVVSAKVSRETTPAEAETPVRRRPVLMRFAAGLSALLFAQTPAAALASTAPKPGAREHETQPIILSAARDAKALAFSLRGRVRVEEIATRCDVHPATIYRWFAKRDKELAAQGPGARGAFACSS